MHLLESPLFLNGEGDQTAKAQIAEAESHLPFAFKVEFVDTRFGRTRIISVGPERAPPLMIWHSLNTPAAFDVNLWGEWTSSFRIYCAPLPGQPGGCYLPPQLVDVDGEVGKWALEVMIGLGIDRCPMVAISTGCNVLLTLARTTPKRIKQAVFINPPAIMPGSLALHVRRFFRFWVPLWIYRTFQTVGSERRLVWTLSRLQALNELPEAPHLRFLLFALQNLRAPLPPNFPGVRVTPRDLAGFEAPTFVVLGRNDLFSPGDQAEARVKVLFRNLCAVEVLVDSHVLGENSRAFIQQRIGRFLRDER